MRTCDAIKYFGDEKALAAALGIKAPSIYGWGETVPKLRQLQLEKITDGKLKADEGILDVPPANGHDTEAAA
jgi:transcriptional repressor of cell division inhibition gene dicB